MTQLAIVFALTCALGAVSGCGTSRIIPTGSSTGVTSPTSDGTYNLTVSATSAGITHSVGLTLVVQN